MDKQIRIWAFSKYVNVTGVECFQCPQLFFLARLWVTFRKDVCPILCAANLVLCSTDWNSYWPSFLKCSSCFFRPFHLSLTIQVVSIFYFFCFWTGQLAPAGPNKLLKMPNWPFQVIKNQSQGVSNFLCSVSRTKCTLLAPSPPPPPICCCYLHNLFSSNP